jgi:hypothetical protein
VIVILNPLLSVAAEMRCSSLSELSIEILRSILSHKSLKLPLEDWLYDFVKEQITRNNCYSTLLELIRYGYLLTESIQDFTIIISQSFDFRTYSLWLSLIHCFTLSVSPPDISDRAMRLFIPGESGKLNKLLSFLSRTCRGNLHD